MSHCWAAKGRAGSLCGPVHAAAEALGVETDLLAAGDIRNRFKYFDFGDGCEGVYERRNAGYINPRRLVAAQSVLAEKAVRGYSSDGGVCP